MTDLQPKKMFLGYAAQLVAQVYEAIEDNYDPQLPQSLIDAFETTKTDLAECVDRRIAVNATFEREIENLKAQEKWISTLRKKMETAQKLFVERTKKVVEENPDVNFKSERFGTTLKVHKNPRGTLDIRCTTVKKQIEGIVDDDTINMFGIDAKYLKYHNFFSLKNDQIKADLEAGHDVPWARLIMKTRLAGLDIKKIKKEEKK